MYSYLVGEVVSIGSDAFVLENHRVGYEISASTMAISHFQIGETYKVYTRLIVREDGLYLYGFYDEEERNMFEMLTKVSAIGPKSAIGILSAFSAEAIRTAILNNDMALLTKAPGVGKKTASRIILELADDMKKLGPVVSKGEQMNEAVSSTGGSLSVALEALVNLGYARNEADRALRGADPALPLEQIIRYALKELA